MDVWFWLVSLGGGAGCVLWLGLFYALLRTLRRLDFLPLVPRRADLPFLSVIVPACNEAGTLQAAAQSLLRQDYPDLEIIIINDRSTDATGAIVDALAAQDPRVKAVHITELPAGWLGKVHAMHKGVEQARGQWLLFTDADVQFRRSTLNRAVQYALAHKLDHLTLIPRLIAQGFPLKVLGAAFGMLLLFAIRRKTEQADSGVGIGAFNLVRRAAFDATAGFAALRLSVVDDFALAMMLARSGARTRVAMGLDAIAVEWYPTARAMIKGLEKNLFGLVGRYRYGRTLRRAALWVLLGIAPAALVLPGVWLPVRIAAALVYTLLLYGGIIARRRLREAATPALFVPLGVLALAWALLRSTFMARRKRGIEWRGTHYSLAELREGNFG